METEIITWLADKLGLAGLALGALWWMAKRYREKDAELTSSQEARIAQAVEYGEANAARADVLMEIIQTIEGGTDE